MSVNCMCGHTLNDHSYERNKEADPEFEPPDCMVEGCNCTGFETPEQSKARRVEAFASRSGRHRRWAEAFIGNDDPLFAIADELVDAVARIDILADKVQSLEFQLNQVKART